eukprot:TRINITY_DN22167_c0_g1_i1.p1 TRINITY_DN22167_c0_g1~~TRINITY_DN22167_c0_g1_i1.p1  ORF type:complete len:829 (+),score=116.26 TRINITY_DN22167_c0_g1_i1:241-2727(+)
MSAITSIVSSISGYIPAVVKDAAGLNPQISEAVRHITWLSVERVFWPPRETLRLMLVLGYTDGFQIWDLQDPSAAREVVSKQDKAVVQARLLPLPIPSDVEHGRGGAGAPSMTSDAAQPLGTSAAPLMAYLHKGSPSLVRLFSLKAHDDVHLLRLTEPAKSLQASRRFFAVGFAKQVELYDALHFQALFSVHCNAAAGPTFALGHRWLAYNLPPQQPAGPALGLTSGLRPRQLPLMMNDGLQYLGQVGQRTLDHMLMPPQGGADAGASAGALRGGVVAVRDAVSRNVISQFEDHTEPVEAMAWDPSGLQLVTCAALGHRILVHRAMLGSEHALMMHEPTKGGMELGSVVFQHLYTLSRGYTPAVISDIAVSDDGQLVAVSSAKGTTHVFRLPPLHVGALGHQFLETGAVRLNPSQAGAEPGELGGLNLAGIRARAMNLSVCCRVRLGSVLLQEGLMPQCSFLTLAQPTAPARGTSSQHDICPRMYVATRTGTLAMYSLSPSGPAHSSSAPGQTRSSGSAQASLAGDSASREWHAGLVTEVHFCRAFRHFTERRLSPRDFETDGYTSRPLSPRTGPADMSGHRASPRLQSWNASPGLRPSSPPLGPRSAHASPGLRPSSPPLGPRAGSPPPLTLLRMPGLASEVEQSQPSTHSTEPSKWLAFAETATHMPVEVPIWMCPQLSFHAYPSSTPRSELKVMLRQGRQASGRKRISITRPDRPGDTVRYDGGASSADAEERLSRLFGGALGTAMDQGPLPMAERNDCKNLNAASASSSKDFPEPRPNATVIVAEAWGQLAYSSATPATVEANLQPMDGIGACLEEVEDDWLKA